jgi:hypothetical protein
MDPNFNNNRKTL